MSSIIGIVTQPEIIIELNTNPIPINGDNGLSAYQIAVNNGFIGTEQEWLDSLKLKQWNSINW